jgi:hypothetical protein
MQVFFINKENKLSAFKKARRSGYAGFEKGEYALVSQVRGAKRTVATPESESSSTHSRANPSRPVTLRAREPTLCSFISPRETTNAARPADTAQAHLSAVTSS